MLSNPGPHSAALIRMYCVFLHRHAGLWEAYKRRLSKVVASRVGSYARGTSQAFFRSPGSPPFGGWVLLPSLPGDASGTFEQLREVLDL